MNILQSAPWAAVKTEFGWFQQQFTIAGVTFSVLYRRLPLGLNMAYIPKGPPIDWHNVRFAANFLDILRRAVRRQGTIFLKIEPDAEKSDPLTEMFAQKRFQIGRAVQPQTTILVDIAPDEAGILARMKSKTRYNIRLAGRKGITIRAGDDTDIATFMALSQVTALRDGFGIHSENYYHTVFNTFPTENRALLLAEFDGEPLAALMAFHWDGVAYYLYGASSDAHRNKMPTYLLQWEAMRWAKTQGCHTYDLWGIPNASSAELEADFKNRSDGLWGVYRFKRGFGGEVVHSVGAFDYVYNRPLYTTFVRLRERRLNS